MKLMINGENKELSTDSMTVSQLLETMEVNMKFVAVEVNSEIVMHDSFCTLILNEGDKIEVVSFVGGG